MVNQVLAQFIAFLRRVFIFRKKALMQFSLVLYCVTSSLPHMGRRL